MFFITAYDFLFWCKQWQLFFFVLKWSTSLSWDCGAFVALLSNAITAHRGTEAGADCSCPCVSVTQALMTEESPVAAQFTLGWSHIQLSSKVFAIFIMLSWMSLNSMCSWFNSCSGIDFGHWQCTTEEGQRNQPNKSAYNHPMNLQGDQTITNNTCADAQLHWLSSPRLLG